MSNEVPPITDVFPWPSGQGFQGAITWWQHILKQNEQQRLEALIGVALLNASIERRLLQEKDESLKYMFALSDNTWGWLHNIQAESLTDLAYAILFENDND